ncbi:MAG: hypothetical protein ABTD50_17860 [Polyangiaceae bacterium]
MDPPCAPLELPELEEPLELEELPELDEPPELLDAPEDPAPLLEGADASELASALTLVALAAVPQPATSQGTSKPRERDRFMT